VSGLTLSSELSGVFVTGSESGTGFFNFLIHLRRFDDIVRLYLLMATKSVPNYLLSSFLNNHIINSPKLSLGFWGFGVLGFRFG
jgi:hypothetical protein